MVETKTKTSLEVATDKLLEGAGKPKDKKLIGEQCKIAALAGGHTDKEVKALSETECEELATLVDAHPTGHMLMRCVDVFWKTVRQRREDAAKKQSAAPPKREGMGRGANP